MALLKQIQLCFLETACTGGYMAAGQWRRPDDTSRTKDTLSYYTNLARLAERGRIAAIFFADWYAGFDVYGGSLDTCLAAGHQVAHLDPLPIISAMAAATESVAFAVTMSTSYATPYVLARQFSTLDHLTRGRVAWNIVTSWSKSSARALGFDDVVPHDERYAVADEFMEVVYQLWESSWAPDAAVWDCSPPPNGLAFDPAKVKKIEHKGKYFKMSGRHQVHPSPQRTPVLFQAGTSRAGTAFATRHAEAIFLNTATIAQTKQTIINMRNQAAAQGRDPASLKFFPCIVPFVGRTEEEAREKYNTALKYADPVAGLAQFSGYTGIDFSKYPLDEPLDLTGDSQALAIQSVFASFAASTPSFSSTSTSTSTPEAWTPRALGFKMALGGLHPTPIGSASQVADVFEAWVRDADVDGFNVASVTNPGSWEDVVDLLRPELVRRGLVAEEYGKKGGTFRENLLGRRGLAEDHFGARYRWGRDGEDGEETKGGGVKGNEIEPAVVDSGL